MRPQYHTRIGDIFDVVKRTLIILGLSLYTIVVASWRPASARSCTPVSCDHTDQCPAGCTICQLPQHQCA